MKWLVIILPWIVAMECAADPIARGVIIHPRAKYPTAPVPEAIDRREDAIKRYAEQVKKLKLQLDEWGSLAFAPPIFTPAEDPGPGKFELKGDSFTLNSLYDDYNHANGVSQFAQRTAFGLNVAGGIGTNTTTQAVVQAQAEVFQTNVDRNLVRDDQEQAQLQATYDQNQAQETTALKLQEDTKADLATKIAARDKAAAEVVYRQKLYDAETIKNPVDNIALNQAKRDLLAAQDAAARTDEAQKTAQKKADDAASAYTVVKGSTEKARNDLLTHLRTPLTLPSNSLPETIATPLASSPILGGATPVAVGGSSNVSNASVLPNMGAGILPPPLSNGSAAMFSPQARVNAAASALTVKNILTFLGNPAAAAQFSDKHILFAVSSLSVNPGWRTRTGFAGLISTRISTKLTPASEETITEILRDPRYPIALRTLISTQYPHAQTEAQRLFFDQKRAAIKSKKIPAITLAECQVYAKQDPNKSQEVNKKRQAKKIAPRDAASVTSEEGAEPDSLNIVAHAVTPMVDSQNLDLASSIARQDEIALYLAASLAHAGSKEGASVFTQWSRSRNKTIATRSTLAVANSFSTGNYFGFEVGTRLRGLDEDAAKGNKAAQVLDRQTFPVLFILGMDADDTRPQLSFEVVDEKIRVTIMEPEFLMHYSTRWSHTAFHSWSPFKAGFWSSLNSSNTRSPTEGYREMLNESKAQEELNSKLYCTEDVCTKVDSLYKRSEDKVMESLQRQGSGITLALYGNRYELQFPSRWLLNRRTLEEGLFDDETRLQGSEIKISPGALSFSSPAEIQTVVLTREGSGLNVIDPTGISIVGDGLVLVPGSPRLLGDDTLALEVKAVADTSGYGYFSLPYRKGAVASAAASTVESIISPAIRFATKDSGNPSLDHWVQPSLQLADVPQSNGHWQSHMELVIQGSHLDQLEGTAEVYGSGIATTEASYSNTALLTLSADAKTATASFTLRTTQQQGSFYLACHLKDSSHATFTTPPVSFTFTEKESPRLLPWKAALFFAKGTQEAAAVKDKDKDKGADASSDGGSKAPAATPAAPASKDGTQEVVSAAQDVATSTQKLATALKTAAASKNTTPAAPAPAAPGAAPAAPVAAPATAKTWAADLQVPVEGRSLDRLSEPTLIGMAGKVTFQADSSHLGSLILHLTGLPAKTGTAYLQFTIKDDAAKARIFAPALRFELIESAK